MEPKVIIYIIIGILYFVYSIWKKAQENKETPPPAQDPSTPQPSRPVSAPASNPIEDVMREIKRRQAAEEARKKASFPQPKPLTTYQQKKPQKTIPVREMKPASLGEGTSNYEPVYERPITEEEKTHSGNIRLKNEGTYRVQTIEELQTESDYNRDYVFELDARQAFIGSIIFERKY